MNRSVLIEKVTGYLGELYPDQDIMRLKAQCLAAMEITDIGSVPEAREDYWSCEDIVLITYADSITSDSRTPLETLKHFADQYLSGRISTIHILPFFPYSSDDGFSVIDYSIVNQSHGDWDQFEAIAENFKLMGDVVLNHCSARSLWFENFKAGRNPGKDFFVTVKPDAALNEVVRPRTTDLLRPTRTVLGEVFVWCTFSHDQVDLNFKNPSVLLRFIKIMIHLINNGVTIFRLDAIAYLWKENGSKCINLKQTHEIIKLLRIVTSHLNIQTIIITETNLPEKENLSYFGKNDEANWIYNFSLPPLLIHGFLFENSSYLNKWSKSLPNTKYGNSYLNFIASHDGIGMRPTEGILNKEILNNFLKRLKKNGSKFSYRKISNKGKKVYEANITIFDALKKSDYDPKGKYFLERYVSAHAVMISFEGIPAIYFNSLFGTSNDEAKFIITGNNRDVNRYKWNFKNISKKLNDKRSKQSIFYQNICNLLNIRRAQKAFHPNASRLNINLGSNIFCFKRTSIDKKQTILCITNLTSKTQTLKLKKMYKKWKNLIKSLIKNEKNLFMLKPFETIWLSNK